MPTPNGRIRKQWIVPGVIAAFTVVLLAWLLTRGSTKPTSVAETKREPTVTKKQEKKNTSPEPKIVPPLLSCPASAAEVKRIQQAWADHLGLPVIHEEDLGGDIKLKMFPSKIHRSTGGMLASRKHHRTPSYS